MDFTLEKLRNKVLYYINYRPRSQHEVLQKLRLLNASETNQKIILEELINVGLINDEKIIELFTRELFEVKNCSENHVRMQLKKKGFTTELINNTISNYLFSEEYHEEDQIIKLLENKYRFSPPDFNKALSFLCRKGFSYSMASKVLNNFINSITNKKTPD